MNKVKMICMAVLLAVLILVPTMAWAQDQTRPMPYCPPGTAAPTAASTAAPHGSTSAGHGTFIFY